MEYKKDWEQTKKRFEALWNREIVDRCCISVKGWKDKSKNPPSSILKTEEELYRHWFDGPSILQRELNNFENIVFGGESFPQIWVNFGPSNHAAYFKDIEYKLHAETIWFHHPIASKADDIQIQYDPDCWFIKHLKETTEFYVKESRGRYLVSMPDMAGDLDALAHIRGSQALLMDMALQPEVLEAPLAEIRKAWEENITTSHELIRDCNEGGGTIGWLDTWAPGLHSQMQVDLSAMISPSMYRQFGLPELEYQSEFLEYPLYHLDGQEQTKFIDMICSVEKLRMIQWTNCAGQPSPTKFIPQLQKIQEAGKALLVRIHEVDEIEPLMQGLSSRGLYLQLDQTLDTEEEVNQVLRNVEKWTKD